MNTALLTRLLRRRGLTGGRVARELGISPGRFGDILAERRGLELFCGQLQVLRGLLRLNGRETEALFFDEELSWKGEER